MKLNSILLAGALVLTGSIGARAQATNGIGIHFGAYDFYGPQTDKYFGSDQYQYEYNDEKNGYDTTTGTHWFWRPMVKVSYWKELTPNVSLSGAISVASLEYPDGNPDSVYIKKNFYNNAGDRNDKFLGELDFRFNYHILARRMHVVSPYLFAGLNASYHDIFFGADIPLGVGALFALTKDKNLSLNLESAYKIAVTDHDANHLQHSVGLVYWFQKGYKAPSKVVPVMDVIDTDKDGIEDTEDQCPTIAGMAQFNGCPDSDADGVSDKDDQCPLVAGSIDKNGCPDSDGDGMTDNVDKCPYVAGTAEREGCPAPDRDKDGFLDDADKCPDTYSLTNNGCPEINREVVMQVDKAAKAIFFETGKATIKPSSYKSLDAVVTILKNDPSLFADIEGHTDNVQPKSYTNMNLSQRRAESVRDYLVSKGINGDRLSATGFGETHPIADNATPQGRSVNRRTVIKLRNFKE